MSYDEVIDAYFIPTPDGVASPPTLDASPARRLRDAIEPLAMHAVWCRNTVESLMEYGLDFLSAYLWGRAAALGEPEPGVVVSSFAVFEPGLIESTYARGRQAVDRDTLLATRTAATVSSLTAILGDDPALPEAADVMQAAVTVPSRMGKPLYSGLAGQPWPSDPVGRLWHACDLAREHRGDSHVAVCVSRGLGPVEMNILTELWVGLPLGSYSATRGWSPEALAAAADLLREEGLMAGGQLSPEGQAFRNSIEEDTDRLDEAIVETLGPDWDAVVDQLATWSQLCVDARAFPPDVFKRAAG
jgi:hypothetical protein